ncbi:MAG: hypothetical protein JWM33_1635 [Caulobacteraceae bacterium]|nr:hypothetical protein [Caulobacteraceae bacterium]
MGTWDLSRLLLISRRSPECRRREQIIKLQRISIIHIYIVKQRISLNKNLEFLSTLTINTIQCNQYLF